MTETPSAPAWPRPYWQAGAGQTALLQFYVFGQFARDLAIPAARYASPGLPAGVELKRFQNLALRKWEGYPLAGTLGELLREDAPEAFDTARAAPEALVVRGELADAASLDYLRDTLGVLAALLDVGGRVVLDPQIFGLFDADAWRTRYLIADGAPPRSHVLIARAPADDGVRSNVHTRGMRKFARPDISLRDVPADQLERAGVLCEKLVEMEAFGARFVAGQVLEVDGVHAPLVAEPGGSLDDPAFNNFHVAFRWPA